MSYRHPRYHAPADNTIEGTIDAIGQFFLLVLTIGGILISPIVLWHLFNAISPQSHTVEPRIPLERAK